MRTPRCLGFSFVTLAAFATAFPKTTGHFRRQHHHFSTIAAATTTTSLASLPTAQGVASAHKLLADKVVRTPLLESTLLNEQLNRRVLLKAECLQTTGSFKYRGALHRLLRLQQDDPESAARGVVAFSSGNFGQALAAAASSLGMDCCIVSPHDAPSIKLDRIQQYGAKLELSTAGPTENREVVASALAQDIAQTRGMTLLHPFEDTDVVHGQGTCGMELLEQAEQLLQSSNTDDDDATTTIGTIVIPCGGGGLTAGINLAVEQQNQQQAEKKINVISVEPKGFDDHAQSFQRNQRTSLAELYPNAPPPGRSVDCDALMAGAPGIKTWQINSQRLSGALESEGDASAANAMRVAFEQFRLVLEPSGALALAAVLDGQIPKTDNQAVVVIASGGNTDLTTFARLMGCTGDNAD
jgi:threonine dehydratase